MLRDCYRRGQQIQHHRGFADGFFRRIIKRFALEIIDPENLSTFDIRDRQANWALLKNLAKLRLEFAQCGIGFG